MNKPFFAILIMLTACAESSEQSETKVKFSNPTEEVYNDEPVQPINTKTPDSLLSLFPSYQTDNKEIVVGEKARSGTLKDSELIPSEYQQYFEGFLYPTRSGSTGSKPIGKFKFSDQGYLLILFQQDDYGPIYYGLIYDKEADKILEKEIIAQEWGDAGDTQVIKTKFKQIDQELQITKFIETCHADLDFSGKEITTHNEECHDSTAMFVIDKNLKFKKIN